MHTKLCGQCYSTIHAASELCPRCGARQMPWIMPPPRQVIDGTLWLPVPALIVAIVTFVLLLFDFRTVAWNDLTNSDTIDELRGLAALAAIAAALGIASLMTQKRGQGMAIAAIVIVSLGVLLVHGWVLG
jgi:putative effector of murein hydrolase LrgA (UPF0299 family)